jgi:hypothetical protein
MPAKLLRQIFKDVYGKPSWRVRRRFGPSVLMEFGNPKIQVWEKVLQPTTKGRKFPKRIVKVYGDWHLTSFDCDWEIRQNNYIICNSHSKTEAIDQGCDILDGQILTKVFVHPKNFITDFYFDLGGHLKTKPYKKQDEPSDMWNLFCPNKRVFSLRSDGTYSYQSGKTPYAKMRYLPFSE